MHRSTILVVLVVFALVPGHADAYLDGIGIEDPPVLENQPLTVNVFGHAPNGCYALELPDEGAGLVEPGVIRVVVVLRYDAAPGINCADVLVPFEVQRTFDDGFASGAYTLEVLERRFELGGAVFEETSELGFEISSTAPPVRHVNGAWGAVKALYSE